ncbi:MAG: bifunctional hydroxymethylpyrimidine kinase/phosphomethylpyrimidine kinase [Erysipelotrichaceae bacterium]|nr:bifunctional hydroxymethylpyrimidine kinase/phosphomethylpyrimidine kinase [Erysipelotrichaceae bacterium]
MNRVCVIGGANVDLSARSFEPIRDYDSNPGKVSYSFGGVAHNIAANMAGFGLPVEYITAFSTDSWGKLLKQECFDRGISIKHSQTVSDEGTSLYLAVVEPDGEMKVAIADMNILSRLDIDVLSPILEQLDQDDLLVLDTNLTQQQISQILSHVHCRVYVDPISIAKSTRICGFFDRLEMLKPNIFEAEYLSGKRIEEEKDCKKMLDWFIDRGIKSIVISMGSKGVMGRRGEEAYHLANADIEIVNTTGAGDAFMAGYIYGQYHGYDFLDSMRYALAASAIAIKSADTVSSEISEDLLKQYYKKIRKESEVTVIR